jgi:uncharacterized membrane protein YgaE (UPF0421/DUF939 family)
MGMVRQAQQEVRRRWRTVRPSFRSKVFLPTLVSRTQILLAAKAAVAAGIAWAVAAAVDPHSRPYFAPLAVILIVQPTVYDSLSQAFQRVVGVVLGVAAALAVSHFLTLSGWSIAIIVFAGLLVGWSIRLGPQGVVQVPVSALLVFAVGSATPGYGGRRVVDTLIGSAVAVLAVLVSPSAPAPERVVSDALAPMRHCRDVLTNIGSAISSAWTLEQAEAWRTQALGLVDATAQARRVHEEHQLTARWNARARRQRPVLDRADGALRVGERVAIQTRSIARALVDGAPAARPMPAVGAMLVSTASAVEAYTVWAASPGEPADRQRLSDAIRVAGETFGQAVTRAQQRWRDDATQWLTFGTILTMSQRTLAEVSGPLELADEAA